ncbi:hypothetical protein [Bacillus sp. V59.32b]|uniref:hypothetical protein n=1 Tax=Bacillus sp. V59.32b TaxID=1758642 RepID=UPI0013598D8F|nr:hypothetical protein [Bacillus sp. V59.32b]
MKWCLDRFVLGFDAEPVPEAVLEAEPEVDFEFVIVTAFERSSVVVIVLRFF